MMRRPTTRTYGVLLACLLGSGALAEDLLQPGDRILAVGRGVASNSGYPAAEAPPFALDVNVETKYLNFGGPNSGVIITLEGGPAVVRSIEMATANDAAERDPATYILYGSNDPILSADNSAGVAETWTEIASGALALPDDRFVYAPSVDVTNDTAYASYKLQFPTLKNSDRMQIAEVEFYDAFGGLSGGGNLLTTPTATILAVHSFNSGYPNLESPSRAIDGDPGSKYLNNAEIETGFIVVPAYGLTRIDSFVVTTAGDAEERDPASFELYGTLDPVFSEDNSDGEAEPWTLIASGALNLPTNRLATSDALIVAATNEYTAYKVIFPTLKDSATANSMQIAEIQFDGVILNPLQGDALIMQGDRIVAIDTDMGSRSSYPGAEAPQWALDDDATTKYLNFAGANTGFIVTPAVGATTVRSFQLTTAGDAADRDPSVWVLYGTDDAITSADNSTGDAENWTLIATGSVSLPDERETLGPVVAVANETAYASYRMFFTELKGGAPLMQVAEVQFYDDAAGAGTALLSFSDAIIAVQSPVSLSGYGGGEAPSRTVDGDANSKYLNSGGENSGFVVMPWAPSTIIERFLITTGNDAENRDPASYELYGSLDPLMSQDNSIGDAESWTLIASGSLSLPVARGTVSDPVPVANTTAYRTYKMVFPTVKDTSAQNLMQIAEFQFRGVVADPGPTPLLGEGDAILAVMVPRLQADSNYPGNESPPNTFDGDPNTKYFNGAGRYTGFIITPATPGTVRSFVMTTANDSDGRDPAEWEIFGTDEAIASTDNSTGLGENWTLIGAGSVALPTERLTVGPVVPVANETAYTSFKMVFTGLRDNGTAMQIADVQFYEGTDGTGTPLLSSSDPVLAIGYAELTSNHPAAEAPARVLDEIITTKYLNFGGNTSGFIVTPAAGSSVVTSLVIRTANDATERDPTSYELYGTQDPITTVDNGPGTDENWTLIASGSVNLPDARFQVGDPVSFANTEAYRSYKLLFPTTKNDSTRMQIAETQFYGLAIEVVEYEILGISQAADSVTLEWASDDGTAYEIYYSTDLSDWSLKLAETVTGAVNSTQHTFTNPMPAADALLFRVSQP